MLEIIERTEGSNSKKTTIYGNPQISFNDWGHIAIRAIHADHADTLVVLNKETSARLINFCKRLKTDERNDVPL